MRLLNSGGPLLRCGLFFVAVLVFLVHEIHCYKLNVPKVLLPYRATPVPVNYTLEVSDPVGACFTWSSSRPDVVSVITDGVECSSRAVVSAVSRSEHRLTAVVSASDSISGLVLRCDVIIDTIHSIEIITTTRQLYLDDSPEAFYVQAKNDQQDTFSELSGIAFNWQLESDVSLESPIAAEKVLRILRFGESKYEVAPEVTKLEGQGRRGHLILVEGIQTASAYISAAIDEAPYQDVAPAKIDLAVIAHLALNPSWDVYVPVFSVVHYIAELIKFGRSEAVRMPSSQYYLQLSDSTIAELEVDKSDVVALSAGSTDIVLKDKNLRLQRHIREPQATINVVSPNSISLVALPGNNWILETGKTYVAVVEVYDSSNRKLFLTNNVWADVLFPSEFIAVIWSTTNQTHFVFRTLAKGQTTAVARFGSVQKPDGTIHHLEPQVSCEQMVEIYDPVQLVPHQLVFPWDLLKQGQGKDHYQHQFMATGGSGSYQWTVDNVDVATVTEYSGLLSVTGPGHVTVTVRDVRSKVNYDTARVYVVPPKRLTFAPSPVEVLVGQPLHLLLAMFGLITKSNPGITEKAFDDCSLVPLSFEVEKEGIIKISEELGPRAPDSHDHCATATLKALQVGDVKIAAHYRLGNTSVSADVTVSVYAPLMLREPGHVPLLTTGSDWLVSTNGGPRPWVLQPSKYFANGELHFVVQCLESGNNLKVEVQVGNLPSATNPYPAVAATELVVECSVPSSVILTPFVDNSDLTLPPCPVGLDSQSPFPVYFKERFELRFIVKDEFGRVFDNFSSLLVEFQLSDAKLASIPTTKRLKMKPEITSSEAGPSVYESIDPKGVEGTLTVTVKVGGYTNPGCSQKDCETKLNQVVEDSIELLLTDSASLAASELFLFNHPSVKESSKVQKGSGYFTYIANRPDANIAHVTIAHNILQIVPVSSGTMQFELRDLCMRRAEAISVVVRISDVATVELEGPTMMELSLSVSITARVKDEYGHFLASDVLPLLNMDLLTEDDGILIKKNMEIKDGKLSFLLESHALGTTSVRCTANRADGATITSSALEIQVYAPLSIRPKHVTLVSGVKFKLTVTGGPQLRSAVVFSLNASNIVNVNSDGLLEALAVGYVAVTGQIHVQNADEGKSAVIREDTVFVRVISLRGIRIHAPVLIVHTATQLPLFVNGFSEEETPFSFDGRPFEFHWTLTDGHDVGRLESVYSQVQINEPPSRQFSKRFAALKPGRATIKVQLQKPSLSATVTVEVIEPLSLLHPLQHHKSRSILIGPNRSVQLSTNRIAATEYHVISISAVQGQPQIKVSKNGLLKADAALGEAVVVVRSLNQLSGHNETIVALVEVKPVAFLMLNVLTPLKLHKPLPHIPVGMQFEYFVSFHDNFGRTFDSVNSSFLYDTNRNDLVDSSSASAGRTSLKLNLQKKGSSVLKAWSGHSPLLVDFIPIDVGIAIEPKIPNRRLTVGDVVCFSSLVSPPAAASFDVLNSFDVLPPPRWSSDRGEVLLIEPKTGVAVSQSHGHALVAYRAPLQTQLEVSIDMPKAVEFASRTHQLKRIHLSTLDQNYVFPVVLKPFSNETYNNVLGQDCGTFLQTLKGSTSFVQALSRPPFLCELKLSSQDDMSVHGSLLSMFSVRAGFDFDSVSYACIVSLLPAENTLEKLQHVEAELLLDAYLTGSKETKVSIQLPFYPQFTVSPSFVQLNNLNKRDAQLVVHGSGSVLKSIQIFSSVEDVLKVRQSHTGSQSGAIQFSVQLKTDSEVTWSADLSELELKIYSELNAQEFHVPVKVKLYGNPPKGVVAKSCPISRAGFFDSVEIWWENYNAFIIYMLTVFATVMAVLIGYRTFIAQFQSFPASTAQPVFASDSIHATPSPTTAGSHLRNLGGSGSPYLWSANSARNGSPTHQGYRGANTPSSKW